MDFVTILDDCLQRMAAGESLEACLERYPQHAAELRPLLETAILIRTTPPPMSAAGWQRGRAAMHQAAAAAQSRQRHPVGWLRGLRWAGLVVAMALVLVVGLTATGQPDSPLAGVRRAAETTLTALNPSSWARAERHLALAERRLAEAQTVWQRRQRLDAALVISMGDQAEAVIANLALFERPEDAAPVLESLLDFVIRAEDWLESVMNEATPAERILIGTTRERLYRLQRWIRAALINPAIQHRFRR
ncbi:MAG: hypothetical protein NZP34_11550, partial [Caldilineales bacterium]|nr:hypothetical protein [Caldilineales bacterium]